VAEGRFVEQPEVAELAVAPISPLDMGMVNMQVTTAKKFPRPSLAKLGKDIEEDLADPEIAALCWYNRHVGTDKDGKKVFAEGASIRLAEIVASHWGNLTIQVSADERSDGKGIMARCRIYDAERNVAIEIPAFRAFTSTKEQNRQNTYNSAVSFAFRGGVFKIVPKAMAERLWRKAKEITHQEVAPKGQKAPSRAVIEKMVATWATKGVGSDELCKYVGKAAVTELTAEDVTVLRGLWTGVVDGEVTVNEAFERAPAPAKPVGVVRSTPPVSAAPPAGDEPSPGDGELENAGF
jgi:hypothetical protein